MCPIFGIVPSSLDVWLDYSMEVLYCVVRNPVNTDFPISWPRPQNMEESASLFRHNRDYGHLLSGIFGVLDGVRMPTATFVDVNLQNAYFEGFTQQDEVTNSLAFNFKEEIIHAALNYSGSCLDSKLAHVLGLYWPKLSDEKTPPGYALLVDSGKLVRARKVNEVNDVQHSKTLAAIDMVLETGMPSERQAAEWGIRAVNAPFKRLAVSLPAYSRVRFRFLCVCCHIYNFRLRKDGLNQLRTVYSNENEILQPWLHSF